FLVGLGFFKFNIVKIGQPAHRFYNREFLMLFYKSQRITTLATAKTLKYILRRIDIKRRRFLIMKGTMSDIIGTSFFQRNEMTYHLHNICVVQYLLYAFVTYHLSLCFRPAGSSIFLQLSSKHQILKKHLIYIGDFRH